MELRQFGPDDASAIRDCVHLRNAVSTHDAPWEHPVTETQLVGKYRFGWDLEPPVPCLASVDGVVVGCGSYSVSQHDNLHLAWLGVEIHPDHRRQGHGSSLLGALVERVRALGRTTVGIACWDLEAPRSFAKRHGFAQASIEIARRQLLAEVDWDIVERRHTDALAHAADYELVRRTGRTPDGELPALAALTAAINDRPIDGLDMEDEVFTPQRIRDYETAQLSRSETGFHRLIARHRGTGELAGQTIVVVEPDRPHLAEQHDTSVVRSHRGHRLGLLLKAEMMLWLREIQPQLESIDTWNAESNDAMIGVNDVLGYRIVGRALDFQKTV